MAALEAMQQTQYVLTASLEFPQLLPLQLHKLLAKRCHATQSMPRHLPCIAGLMNQHTMLRLLRCRSPKIAPRYQAGLVPLIRN